MKSIKLQILVATGAFVCTGAFADGTGVRDPGVRQGAAGAGQAIPGLRGYETDYFKAGLEDFSQAETLAEGLGPRFNLDGCAGCHAAPAIGGTSPAVNPQVTVATAFGARNTLPSFIRSDGPVREARFKFTSSGQRDGGVHALFVISGRNDGSANASGCRIQQDDFDRQLSRNNAIFRIPTPVFGAGLIELIPDSVILANLNADSAAKSQLGISGRANRSGNDGTVTRFGWKAQNKSLMVFSGEAYNVEMGISNEAFQSEREENPGCQLAQLPNDISALDGGTGVESVSGVEKFSFFMRFLAAPTPAINSAGGATSIANGHSAFVSAGCAQCHTPTLLTGNAGVPALTNQKVNLFSDLGLHRMGPGLADNILQGAAAGDEFRTAPLWGVGQRIFFLHDGRTKDLLQAIQAHASNGNSQFGPSEANKVVDQFNNLPSRSRQDVLNFLRSL
ncbi:MAG TPA: di-heme oxidoredictase family protein [Steroidobacteraceae bacterium]|nr:di-heme oxidoredictase family protein [Steroidobacteraceae bacterium]